MQEFGGKKLLSKEKTAKFGDEWAKKQLAKALKKELPPHIKLRAQDLEQKLKLDAPKETLF